MRELKGLVRIGFKSELFWQFRTRDLQSAVNHSTALYPKATHALQPWREMSGERYEECHIDATEIRREQEICERGMVHHDL